MGYIPTVVGAAIMFALCYLLAYTVMTGFEKFLAVAALVIVYVATTVWYIKKHL